MNLPPQHVPIVDDPDPGGRPLLSKLWYGPLKQLVSAASKAVIDAAAAATATDPSTLSGFTIGTITATWSKLQVTGSPYAPGHPGDVLQLTIPVTPPSPIGNVIGAHLYIENPDQSTGTSLKLDGTTALGSAKPVGSWAPQDFGQQPYVAGQAFVAYIHDASPGQQIRVYVQAYTDVLDAAPVQAGTTGATPSALVTVPNFAPLKVGSGTDYEPLISLVSVTTLTDDWSTGTRRTPIVVKVDPTSLPNPAPDNWACEAVLVWDNDPSPDPNAAKNIATGTFGIDEIIANNGILPAGQDGIAAAHTLALDTPTSLIGLTVYVRSLKRLASTSARSGTPQTRERLLRNTIVLGVTPSGHVVIGATDGTVDIGAALTNSISSEFHVVTVAGQKQLQMLNLDMTKASHLSSQFAFDPALSVQRIAQLDAGILISGFLQIGGGGNKVSQAKFFDTSGIPQLFGFIGDDSAGTGYVGAWFKRCAIGGTSPATAKILADANGNVAISGSLIVGPVNQASTATIAAIFNGPIQATQVQAGQFVGLSMVLNKNGVTSVFDNLFDSLAGGFVGAKFTDNATGYYSYHWPLGIGCVAGGVTNVQLRNNAGGDGQLIVANATPAAGRRFEFRSARGVTLNDFANGVSGDGLTTTVSYTKPGGATGTLTYCMGWLIGFS